MTSAPETPAPAAENASPERAKTIMIAILFIINMSFLALFTFYQPPDPDIRLIVKDMDRAKAVLDIDRHYARFLLLRFDIVEGLRENTDHQQITAMVLQARRELESILRFPDAETHLRNNDYGLEDVRRELETINKLADRLAGKIN